MIPARWTLAAPADPEATGALAAALHIPEPLAALLVQRGLEAPEVARAFLRPDLERLSDPADWAGMRRAVDLIVAAVRRGAAILVHGDYDVDGQCAAAMLTRILRAAGATVHAFVPHRLRDGYDFGPAGLAQAQAVRAGLIITCDCGITAARAVEAARAAGIDVIVTDHHLPGDELPPASAVLDPRRADCPSVDKDLCGAGVAFKLAQAVVRALGLSENLPLHFLDFVALATVADVVPLTGENRILVRHGLKVLADSHWPGVRALVEAAGLPVAPRRDRDRGFAPGGALRAPRLSDRLGGRNGAGVGPQHRGLRPPRRAASRGRLPGEVRRPYYGGRPHHPAQPVRRVPCCLSPDCARAACARRPRAGAACGSGAAAGAGEGRAGEADAASRALRARQSGPRVRRPRRAGRP